MKKTTIILGLIILIGFIPPEKKYHFEFSDQQLNILWNCIDNSNAPHSQVRDIQALIQQQLKGQMDTSKIKK